MNVYSEESPMVLSGSYSQEEGYRIVATVSLVSQAQDVPPYLCPVVKLLSYNFSLCVHQIVCVPKSPEVRSDKHVFSFFLLTQVDVL